MWTKITRPKYKQGGLFATPADAEWAMIEPRLPQRNRLGRLPKTETRNVVNVALMVRTGCSTLAADVPREMPPYTTVHRYSGGRQRRRGIGAGSNFLSCCCKP